MWQVNSPDTPRPSYYDISLFPALKDFSDQWMTVRDEYLEIDAPVMNLHRHDKSTYDALIEIQDYVNSGNEYGWIQGWGKSGPNPEWIQYALMIDGSVIPYVGSNMSQTIEMLKHIQGIKVCALFILKAHCSLPCHTHPELHDYGLLQYHIPLLTAEKNNYAYLNVMGEFRQHVCGEPIVFDGSLSHFAVNESNTDRALLYFEFFKDQLLA